MKIDEISICTLTLPMLFPSLFPTILVPPPRLLPAHTSGGCVCRRGSQNMPPFLPPPILFVENEWAIGIATSLVRPKKSKSIDMRLDWGEPKQIPSRFYRSRLRQPRRLLHKNPSRLLPPSCSPTLRPRHHLLSLNPHTFFTRPFSLSQLIITTDPVAKMQSPTGTILLFHHPNSLE